MFSVGFSDLLLGSFGYSVTNNNEIIYIVSFGHACDKSLTPATEEAILSQDISNHFIYNSSHMHINNPVNDLKAQ